MAVLFLRILGDFQARRSTGEIAEIPIRKGKALLAFLALNPGKAAARSKLAGLLWGDRSDTQANASLRQTLTVLRKALVPVQDQVLHADRESISIDSAAVGLDAVLFQDLIASGTPSDLEKAVSLYRGELLDGLDLPDPGFQDWLEEERRRFRDLMAGALTALMAHKRTDGAPQDAVVLGQRLLTMDPLREDVHRALMVIYAELGQRQAALQQYQRCRELLAGELNVAPEAETEALHEALRKNDAAGDGTAADSGAIVTSRRESGDSAQVSLGDRTRRPPVATTGVSRGSRRWAHAAGKVIMTGGMAALVWLLPWAPSFEQSPPDRMPLQRADVPLLVWPASSTLSGMLEGVTESSKPVPSECIAIALPGELSEAALPPANLSGVLESLNESSLPVPLACMAFAPPGELLFAAPLSDNLAGISEGVSESSGPASLDRMAFAPPENSSPAAPPFDDLSRVLERVTEYSASVAPAKTEPGDEERRAMQREADGLWPELAESWDLRAVRAFKARYPEGIWGLRSVRAMRAFQSENGLTPDGAVSEALLERLTAASQEVASPTASPPELLPVRAEPEVVAAPPSTRDGIPDDSRWTASGKSVNGSRIVATATRRGDTLRIVFDVDHRDYAVGGGSPFLDRYTQNCRFPVSDAVIECWIAMGPPSYRSVRIFGTFPRLTYERQSTRWTSPITDSDIVLDFRSELETAALKIATPAAPAQELQPVRPEPEVAVASLPALDTIPDGSRWAASGKSNNGSKILATATRRGDALKLVFDVDHRNAVTFGLQWPDRYTQSCTVLASDPIIECWIPGSPSSWGGAIVFGTFPQLTVQYTSSILTGDTVLDFRPEPRLAEK
jgi:DNA-binding SARP family transcriptional activator/peptidoglycan hydrolase-like protein with peptidoglycan-binding domain